MNFKKVYTRTFQVIGNIIYWPLITFLTLSVILFGFTWATTGERKVWDTSPIIIETGSMQPTIRDFSLIIGKTPKSFEDIEVGDIVTFRVENIGTEKRITHRVISKDIENRTFGTQGDANNSEDRFDPALYPNGLPYENVQYKIVKVMNWFAPIGIIFQSPVDIAFLIIGVVGIFLLLRLINSFIYDKEYEYTWFRDWKQGVKDKRKAKRFAKKELRKQRREEKNRGK